MRRKTPMAKDGAAAAEKTLHGTAREKKKAEIIRLARRTPRAAGQGSRKSLATDSDKAVELKKLRRWSIDSPPTQVEARVPCAAPRWFLFHW
jgi:hypothetical protein